MDTIKMKKSKKESSSEAEKREAAKQKALKRLKKECWKKAKEEGWSKKDFFKKFDLGIVNVAGSGIDPQWLRECLKERKRIIDAYAPTSSDEEEMRKFVKGDK